MKDEVIKHLYNHFYGAQKAESSNEHASAHWKSFSENFQVEFNTDGTIKTIKGYGFGGSDDKGFVSKLVARIGNLLIRSGLKYPGLDAEINDAKNIVNSMGLDFSQDALRQACTCFFINKHIQERELDAKRILIIGDGHGILAALLSVKFPQATIYLVDLGQTLFFQAFYLGRTFPNRKHTLLGNDQSDSPVSGFYYCPAEGIEKFPEMKLDLAINVASMQEMTMDVVNNYFALLRKNKTGLFYCCNRLEKTLPDGQVIRFSNYPWNDEDHHIVDEKCPWHQYFFGKSASENIKLFNLIPVPMLHKYDGVHWHRLTQLHSK